MAWTVARTVTDGTDTVIASDHNQLVSNFAVLGGSDGNTKTGGYSIGGVLTVTAGSEAAPSIVPSGDANNGIWFPAADTIAWSTAGTERMRINSSGEIGIGGVGAGAICTAYGSLGFQVKDTTNPYFQTMATLAGTNLKYWRFGSNSSGAFNFETVNDAYSSAISRMTITSAGNVGIGTSSPNATLYVAGTSNFVAASGSTFMVIDSLSGQAAQIVFQNLGANKWFIHSSGDTRLYILDGGFNDGVYIAQNATSWTANSDSRLKDVKETISNALDKVNQLTGVKFTWKRDANNPDAKTRVGLIAQDVLSVLPEAVDDETPDIITDEETGKVSGGLGVRYTEIVPLLVNAIKELAQRVEALEA